MASKKDNTGMLYTIIAVLALIVVWLIWYFLGQGWWWVNISKADTPLIAEAWNIWIDKDDLKECIASNKYVSKINSQMKVWSEVFWVTGTPGNVLINNETLEYEVISWAYPKENFIELIDRLLSDKAWEEKEESLEKKDFTNNTNPEVVIIITDKRDSATPIDQIVSNLNQIESIKKMDMTSYDFSDNWVSEYLIENEIKVLPAVIFAKNEVDSSINEYLVKLKEDNYSLNIGATFDPFQELSNKWFKTIDKETIEKIKKDSFIEWNADAKITWLEYSDLECPFCAKLHNSDVETTLKEKYGTDLNIIFNHFPLAFHKKAVPWAEILECVWELGWSEAFYKIMRYAFKNEIQE